MSRHRIKRGGYWALYRPSHPNSWKQGYVLEHRLIMEEHIGRYLTKLEVVHHKDGDTENNEIENLELCVSAGQHTRNNHPEAYEKARQKSLGRKPSNYNRSIKVCSVCSIDFVTTLGISGKKYCSQVCSFKAKLGVRPQNTEGLKLGWGWNKGLSNKWVKRGKESHKYIHGRYCKKVDVV